VTRSRRPTLHPALAPASLVVGSHAVQVGEQWVRTYRATDYPAELPFGWIEQLMVHRGRVDVSLHITPTAPDQVAAHLQRQRGRMESSLRVDAKHGNISDPALQVAAHDAQALALELARGNSRVFKVGLYVSVRADSEEELNAECRKVCDAARGMLFQLQPATYKQQQGWLSTVPLGLDELGTRRSFTTEALAASFPFSSAELPTFEGVLYGRAWRTKGLVRWNRFAQLNYNEVILGASGGGKSYLTKLETLEWLLQGVTASVIDRESEWTRLTEAVGGIRIPLGQSGVRVNPFDIGPQIPGDDQGPLIRRALFIHTLVSALLRRELTSSVTAALDRAVVRTYDRAGITGDPATHRRQPPLLSDLVVALRDLATAPALQVADDLYPYTEGMFRGLFDGPTSIPPQTAPLVVWDMLRVPSQLRSVAHLLVMDRVSERFDVVQEQALEQRHLLVIEELWELMRDPAGAAFVDTFSRKARHRHIGVTAVTQQAADLLGSAQGRTVVDNADTQIVLRQSRQAIGEVAKHFDLSDGERRWLVGCKKGEGILIGGQDRVAFRSVAAPDVKALITTDPEEVADLARAEQRLVEAG